MIVMLLLWPLSLVLAETAEEIMKAVVENIEGPPDKVLVASGHMRLPEGQSDVCAGRAVQIRESRLAEGFQVDLLSPSSGVGGGFEAGGRVLRFVRDGNDTQALSYFPSLRRGRKIAYVPLDGVLGGDLKYGLLPVVSSIREDFTYEFSKKDTEHPVIVGVRKPNSPSPFQRCILSLEKQESVYVVLEATYTYTNGGGPAQELVQTYSDYREVAGAPGYRAPYQVVVGDTTIAFKYWQALPWLGWLLSTNHAALGTNQMVPCRSLPTGVAP